MDIMGKTSNEKRLIDANEYCMELYNEMNYPGRSEEFMTAIDVAIADLADAPTVDAVEVVRCRECKHRGTDDCIFHIKGEPADEELLLKLDNDFCSYGERKEGDGNG